METHIQTLSSNTPKARRRVRKILGLTNLHIVTHVLAAAAVVKAIAKEKAKKTNS